MRNSKILEFIDHFNPDSEDVTKVFTEGMCYWFSYILKGRFPSGKIVYDGVQGHFLFKHGFRLYDITGDVTKKYTSSSLYDIEWLSKHEPSWYMRIYKDCILKTI